VRERKDPGRSLEKTGHKLTLGLNIDEFSFTQGITASSVYVYQLTWPLVLAFFAAMEEVNFGGLNLDLIESDLESWPDVVVASRSAMWLRTPLWLKLCSRYLRKITELCRM
jgi:hypothetical protein